MPRAIRIAGWLIYPGAVLVGARFLWEETFLTWESGPQMVGFSIMHSDWAPLVLIGLLNLFLLYVWTAVALTLHGWAALHRRWPTKLDAGQFVLVAATVALFTVPYGIWQWVGVELYGPGPHAVSFLTFGAAEGDTWLVKALLEKGVPVNAGETNATALSGAAVEGQLKMVRLLLDHGANINLAVGGLKETPLMEAVEMGHLDVVRLLLSRGADKELRDANGRTAADMARRPDLAALFANGKTP